VSLKTFSKFFYGYEVNSDALYLDISEGSGEMTAELEIDSYSLNDFINEVSRQLNAVGGQEYIVSVDRATRLATISAPANFSLLVGTGSHRGATIFGALGFTGNDLTGAKTYTGNLPAGSEYAPQFILQSYVSSDDQRGPAYGVVNKSASGVTETVTYGEENLIGLDIKFANNYAHSWNGPIKTNSSGVLNLRNFMKFCVTKSPLEFMADEANPDSFQKVILESTPDDKNGLRFKLRELYDKGLPGYYETGSLVFRVLK